MNLLKLLPLLLLFSTSIFSQDAAREWTVQMTATVNEDPASITLNWLPNSNETPTTYYVFRKEKGTNGWGTALALLDSDILTYTDETAVIGISYEYYLQLRLGGTIYAWGFINSGINLQLDPNKGDLLLIVDETFEVSLASEITNLAQDLYTDGWMVTTIYSNPADTPQDLKEEITTFYEDLPNLKALYLLGNIPVPYSGELYPDAHDNHIGAWPADVYYGDIDGNWTDTDVNNISASSSRNHNIPGDGKFDQSKIPSKMELQVSRVDFNDLPVYGETEEELLQNYLDKAHEFKTAEYVPSERGLVDQGTFTGLAEGFAQNGFRNFTAFFGAENVDHIDYWSNLNGNDYLWSYGCGGGSYTSVAGLNDGASLTSAGIAAGYSESTFTMLFGSYFGDWDVTNNLMRTAVANGRTLACSWAARPNWYYHNMAMGENLGYSTLLSQDIDGDYISLTLGDGTFVTGEGVHVNQLGDPSLRMYYLAPPSDVIVDNDVSNAELSWTASTDGSIEGYNIYRRATDELWSKLNTEIVTATSFTDIDLPGADEYEYLVKSVKLKTNSSGTFYNESLGAIGGTTFYVSIASENKFDFKMYPNPSNGFFTVKTTRNMDQLTIQSIAGTIVYSELVNSATTQVQLEDLESGIYFVTIEGEGEKLTQRIVIL
ncbi:MAG: T9SS type A sorting domain-containing protein [Crocinitomix sp.]|nr:T9SS type A sorting domain-containing protein [Crocinitomix sp.]